MSQSLKKKFIRLDKNHRLHEVDIPIIGITGGIASGKSTFSNILKNKGFTVINADCLIHQIYKKKETLNFIKSKVPEAIKNTTDHNDEVNFVVLREKFFNDSHLKKTIEDFLYRHLPKVFKENIPESTEVLFYDVPLLFEKGLEKKVDVSVVVTTTQENQLERLKERDQDSSEQTNRKILQQQMPLESKENLADYVITNNGGLDEFEIQANKLIESLF